MPACRIPGADARARTAIIQPRHADLGFHFGTPRDDPLGRPSRPPAVMTLRDDPSRLARGGEIDTGSERPRAAGEEDSSGTCLLAQGAVGTGGQPAHARSREAYG
ncbi:hypothetical protein V502_10039, partial [Pseudogymnoascus sp. VKM F-4520 (FW-2644)]